MRAEIAGVRIEIAELRSDMHAQINNLLVWLSATIVASASVAVTVTVNLVG